MAHSGNTVMLLVWTSCVLMAACVYADYECVCTYNVETSVYSGASKNSSLLGYMYEFDCRPTVHLAGAISPQWKTIAYQHQAGYLFTDSQTTTQTCPGSPSDSEILIPTILPPTTAKPTNVSTTPSTVSTTESSTERTTPTTKSTTSQVSTPSPTPNIPGNVQLCPHVLHQYTIEDKGALAQFGDSCYEIVPIQTTWLKGEKDCVAKGGHLFHISNQLEQDFILAFINFHQFAHACWMGLHDQIKEEMFEWTSGDNVTYINWWHDRYGNIMSHHQEDCVLFVPYSPYFGKWDDVPCGYTDIFGVDQVKINPFICQFPIHGHYVYAPLSSVIGKRHLRGI